MRPDRDPETDRLIIEAELSAEQVAALRQGCAAERILEERWRDVPAIARVFERWACLNLAIRIVEDEGESETAALELAAARLGLEADTIRKGRQRTQRAARRLAKTRDKMSREIQREPATFYDSGESSTTSGADDGEGEGTRAEAA